MKRRFKRALIFSFLAAILLAFWFPKTSFAYPIDGGYPDCPPGQTTCSLPDPGICSISEPRSCNKCTPGSSNDCCSNGSPWTKYKSSCKLISPFPPYFCDWAWVYDTTICSIADKCIPGDTGLKGGLCDCSVGGIYKTCCKGGSPVECVRADASLQDTTDPPAEGVCPSGSTEVRCGGSGEPACSSACATLPSPSPGVSPSPGASPTPAPATCSYPNEDGSYAKPNCSVWTQCPNDNCVFPDGCCGPPLGGCAEIPPSFTATLQVRNVTRGEGWTGRTTTTASPGEIVELQTYWANTGSGCYWNSLTSVDFNWKQGAYDRLIDGATYWPSQPGDPPPIRGIGGFRYNRINNPGCNIAVYCQQTWPGNPDEGWDPQDNAWRCGTTSFNPGFRCDEDDCDPPPENDEHGGAQPTSDFTDTIAVQINPGATDDMIAKSTFQVETCAVPNPPFDSNSVVIDVEPICTVSLSPDPLTIQEGGTSPLVATVNVQSGQVSRVDFSSSETRYATVNPSSDTTPSYSTTVSGVSRGSATLTARVYDAGGVSRCEDTSQVTVTAPGPWFQTQGGDVHGEGGVSSPIPSTATNRIFSLDLDGYPGVVSYGPGANYDFRAGTGQGEDLVSSTGWLANSSYSLPYSYAWFYDKFGSPTSPAFSCDPGCPSPTSGQTTVYYASGDVAINQAWVIPGSGTKVVVFVHGDLTINGQANREVIDVPEGSFLAFIASGDINITGRVGDKRTATDEHHLQGVYIADGQIKTNSDDDPSGRRLVAAGLFYARDGFDLGRDLGSTGSVKNSLYPAEFFIFRPDLVINSPRELWVSKMSWQEVAP